MNRHNITVPYGQYCRLVAVERSALALLSRIHCDHPGMLRDIEVENLVAALAGNADSLRAVLVRAALMTAIRAGELDGS